MTFGTINAMRLEVKKRGLRAPRGASKAQLAELLDPRQQEPEELPGEIRRALRVVCRECPNAGKRLRKFIEDRLNAIVT